mgnify:FL=1
MGDESILPWSRAERPVPKTDLQEYLENQQISRLYYLDEVGPTGSRGLAIELTTGAKLVIWAGRDRNSVFSARLFFRWIPAPLIVLPRMARAFAGGRDGDPASGPPDDLQRAIEGHVIRGVLHSRRPTNVQGEQMAIEMTGGGKFALGAAPIMRQTADGAIMIADLVYEWSEPERARIVLP